MAHSQYAGKLQSAQSPGILCHRPPQNIVAPLSIPARKKPRLEETPPATTDEAAKKTASPEISVGLPPPTADNDDANADPVTDTHDVLD
jgi:hypothetical protein